MNIFILIKGRDFVFSGVVTEFFVEFRYISIITCIRVCVLGPSNLEAFPSTFKSCLQHTTLFCYVSLAGHAHQSARHWTKMEFWHALKDHCSKNTSFSGRSDNSIIYSKSLLFVISSRYFQCKLQQNIQGDSFPTLPGTWVGTVRSVVLCFLGTKGIKLTDLQSLNLSVILSLSTFRLRKYSTYFYEVLCW